MPANITSIPSNNCPVGAATMTLHLLGTGFAADDVVVFDGTTLSTTFVSSTDISFTLPQSRVQISGKYLIWIQSADVSNSNAVEFIVYDSDNYSIDPPSISQGQNISEITIYGYYQQGSKLYVGTLMQEVGYTPLTGGLTFTLTADQRARAGALPIKLKTAQGAVQFEGFLYVVPTIIETDKNGTRVAFPSREILIETGRLVDDPESVEAWTDSFVYDAQRGVLKRIEIGGVNSGGTGYRLLRIKN